MPSLFGGRDDALARIEAKLDRLEQRLSGLGDVFDMAPAGAAMVGDIIDEFAEHAELAERINAAIPVLDRLTHPETLAQLAKLLELAEAAPGVISTLLDMADDYARPHVEAGLDMAAFLDGGVRMATALGTLAKTPAFEQLLKTGPLSPTTVELATRAAAAAQSATQAPTQKYGLFALLGILKDPEIQKTISFGIAFARAFGANTQQIEQERA